MSLSKKSALALALMSGLAGATVMGVVRSAGAVSPAIGAQNEDENYPHMRKAMHELHEARDSLVAAEDIFKGRREEAIKHTDEAIHECEQALAEH